MALSVSFYFGFLWRFNVQLRGRLFCGIGRSMVHASWEVKLSVKFVVTTALPAATRTAPIAHVVYACTFSPPRTVISYKNCHVRFGCQVGRTRVFEPFSEMPTHTRRRTLQPPGITLAHSFWFKTHQNRRNQICRSQTTLVRIGGWVSATVVNYVVEWRFYTRSYISAGWRGGSARSCVCSQRACSWGAAPKATYAPCDKSPVYRTEEVIVFSTLRDLFSRVICRTIRWSLCSVPCTLVINGLEPARAPRQ